VLLEDIKRTIDEMSAEELCDALRDIRHNRTKETIIITKAREKKDASEKLLQNMTPEIARVLLKQMGVEV